MIKGDPQEPEEIEENEEYEFDDESSRAFIRACIGALIGIATLRACSTLY